MTQKKKNKNAPIIVGWDANGSPVYERAEDIQKYLAGLLELQDRDRIPDPGDPYDNDEYSRSHDEDDHREKNDAQLRHEEKIFGK